MFSFIEYKKYSGSENMAFDETLLDFSIRNNHKALLRLYGWQNPTVTVGRNQNIENINLEYCKKHKIEITKRPTGGRALYHNDELTYSFICAADFLKNGGSVINSYKEISNALVEGLKILNVELEYPEYKKVSCSGGYCMSLATGSDLSYQGKKLVGSAQFRKNGYILQHGSIPLTIDFDIINKIFFEQTDSSKITTLNEINPNIDIDTLCKCIKKGFENKFEINLIEKSLATIIEGESDA
jgi:lipoate-protein ligase A